MARQTGQLAKFVEAIKANKIFGVITARDVSLVTGMTEEQAKSVLSNAANRTKICTGEGQNAAGQRTYTVNVRAAENYKYRGRKHTLPAPTKSKKGEAPDPIEDLLTAMAEAEPILRRMSAAYRAMKHLDD